MPSTPPGHVHEFSQVWEHQKQTKDFAPKKKQAVSLHRNKIADDQERAKTQILFRFPPHAYLTPVPFAKENEAVLPCDVKCVEQMAKLLGKREARVTDYIVWPVGIVEIEARRADDVPKAATKNSGAARLRERMSRMSTNPS